MPIFLPCVAVATELSLLRRWCGLLLLCLPLLCARQATAAPEDTLAANPAHPELYVDDNYYSMLEDPTGRLTIADVQSPPSTPYWW